MSYPICETCGRSIMVHYLRGHIAYCDSERATRAPFRIADVLLVRRVVGFPVSDTMRDLELKEKREEAEQQEPS